MLKLALGEEERSGGALVEWWDGTGAALAWEGGALLLERAAEGAASPPTWPAAGATTRRAASCAPSPHGSTPRGRGRPRRGCGALAAAVPGVGARRRGPGRRARLCAGTAQALLAKPREIGALHGDLHHGNVLDFGARGWLAIDPEGLASERGFGFADIVANPDLADLSRSVVTGPGRFARRLAVMAGAAGWSGGASCAGC